MSVAFEGPPELGPPPPGGSLFRAATTTPGHVLRESDYARCQRDDALGHLGPVPGRGRGRDDHPIVEPRRVRLSRSSGTAPGATTSSTTARPSSPRSGGSSTTRTACRVPGPMPSACAAWDAPITFVWQGTRPVMANLQGNVVEAYPPGSAAEVGVWADVLYEEAERHADRGRRRAASTSGPSAPTCGSVSGSPTPTSACGPSARARGVAASALHVGRGSLRGLR